MTTDPRNLHCTKCRTLLIEDHLTDRLPFSFSVLEATGDNNLLKFLQLGGYSSGNFDDIIEGSIVLGLVDGLCSAIHFYFEDEFIVIKKTKLTRHNASSLDLRLLFDKMVIAQDRARTGFHDSELDFLNFSLSLKSQAMRLRSSFHPLELDLSEDENTAEDLITAVRISYESGDDSLVPYFKNKLVSPFLGWVLETSFNDLLTKSLDPRDYYRVISKQLECDPHILEKNRLEKKKRKLDGMYRDILQDINKNSSPFTRGRNLLLFGQMLPEEPEEVAHGATIFDDFELVHPPQVPVLDRRDFCFIGNCDLDNSFIEGLGLDHGTLLPREPSETVQTVDWSHVNAVLENQHLSRKLPYFLDTESSDSDSESLTSDFLASDFEPP